MPERRRHDAVLLAILAANLLGLTFQIRVGELGLPFRETLVTAFASGQNVLVEGGRALWSLVRTAADVEAVRRERDDLRGQVARLEWELTVRRGLLERARGFTPLDAEAFALGEPVPAEVVGVGAGLLDRVVTVNRGRRHGVSQDAAVMTRSVPMKKAFDDAMLVYAQNGDALMPGNGYPVRLLLPGWEGNASVKWLRRIELADGPFMTREETSKYTDPLGDGSRSRQFSFVMDARSIVTDPAYPRVIGPGFHEIRGLAWSGRDRIARVEVSTDGGATWREAELQTPVLPKAHVRFRLPWRRDGGPAEIMSRATDETGYVQPTWEALVAARGPRTRYHGNPITPWTVGADGRVLFGAERLRS